MNNPRETVDYKLIESPDIQDQYDVQILKGEYTDVIYKYGSVSFKEEKKQLRILFDYEIIETPINLISENLKSDPKFKELISNILGAILSTGEAKLRRDVVEDVESEDVEY